jgi:two-component system, response regulator YesN
MYKLLIVDDEQIVLDSIKFIIGNFMGNMLLTETARSGREAIEKAEAFMPDIVIMDIKMPGISGLDAIASIKLFNSGAVFIVVTAYEKFDFAKEALHLGATDYINKPLSRDKVVAALENAIRIKDAERKKLGTELELKEKMAFILPALENSFIYAMVFSDDHMMEMESFKKILDIKLNGGYVMTAEFGEGKERNALANKVGTSIQNQQFHPMLRDAIKESCTCITGPVMLNRIIAYVPCDCDTDEYEQRIEALRIASEVYRKLKSIADNIEFYIGIGKSCKELCNAYKSYEESLKAIGYARSGGVFHINDIPLERGFSKSYPENEEKLLLKSITSGGVEACLVAFEHIFEWLRDEYGDSKQEIASGLTELVVLIGRIAKDYGVSGGGTTGKDYLKEFLAIDDLGALKAWLKSRIRSICEEISNVREKKLSGIIVSAKDYISGNYCSDITLEDVSREVSISPNYFSKLFKDETGSNFIDYLTMLRIDKAKKLLADSKYANKEICYQIGYSDPNYFSRIFKKIVGVTPTEYRSNFMGSNQ